MSYERKSYLSAYFYPSGRIFSFGGFEIRIFFYDIIIYSSTHKMVCRVGTYDVLNDVI